MVAPDDPKSFQKFVIESKGVLPNADGFLKYKSQIKKLLKNPDSKSFQTLETLNKSLDEIIENLDPKGLYKKASENYAIKKAPFKTNEIKGAINSGKFKEKHKGAPSVTDTFKKQSPENSQVFEQLALEDKERVIAGFVEDSLESKHKSEPARAIHEAWHNLPKYIKETDDKKIQAILQELETIASKNQTLSSIQQATNDNIGSRKAVSNILKWVRGLGYSASLVSGNTPLAGIAFLGEMGTRGGKSALQKSYLKKTGQRNLKYYMKPELLERKISEQERALHPSKKTALYEGLNNPQL